MGAAGGRRGGPHSISRHHSHGEVSWVVIGVGVEQSELGGGTGRQGWKGSKDQEEVEVLTELLRVVPDGCMVGQAVMVWWAFAFLHLMDHSISPAVQPFPALVSMVCTQPGQGGGAYILSAPTACCNCWLMGFGCVNRRASWES